jgi:hypothetical protein
MEEKCVDTWNSGRIQAIKTGSLTSVLLHCFNGQFCAALSLAAPVQVGHDAGPLKQVIPETQVNSTCKHYISYLHANRSVVNITCNRYISYLGLQSTADRSVVLATTLKGSMP